MCGSACGSSQLDGALQGVPRREARGMTSSNSHRAPYTIEESSTSTLALRGNILDIL